MARKNIMIRIPLFLLLFLFTGQSLLAASLPFLATTHKRKPVAPTTRAQRISVGNSRIDRAISAKSAIIMDSYSGDVLYAKAPGVPRQPASTIKILTGLIAIDSLNSNEKVTVSRRAARMPRSKIYLDPAKWYRANDLINAVLLASANDASVALGEKICGNEKSFARSMTEKAKELGASDTLCKSASGLTRRGQHSTARDLAVMFNEAMKNKEFARRIGRSRVKTSYGKLLYNHNKALWQINGALGGKTGYTSAARQTYVGKFKRRGREIVVAIMGSESMWDDINRLVRHGFKQIRNYHRPESVDERLAKLRRQLELQDQFRTVQVLSQGKKYVPNMAL